MDHLRNSEPDHRDCNLEKLFPAYFTIDENLIVVDQGPLYSKLVGDFTGRIFTESFQIKRPGLKHFSFETLSEMSEVLFVLELKQKEIRFRGQFMTGSNGTTITFYGSPWMNSLEEFLTSGIQATDLALHDPLVDLLQVLKGQEIVTDDIRSLLGRISEQKEEIEQREIKYRELLTNLYDGVISFDENSNIIECNKALCNITEYSEEELLRMSGKDITYFEDWDIAKKSTEILRRDGFISNFKIRCITKSGKIKHIEISSNAIFIDGIYKGSRDIVRDVSERLKTEEMLRDLSMVSERTSNMVIIAGADRKILWVNKSFTDITGYSLEEVIGKIPGSVLQGKGTNPETVNEMRNALASGTNYKGLVLNYTKSGKAYWNEIAINPVVDATGKIEKYISVATDVTERIQKNEELLNSELRWKFALEGSGDGVFEFEVEKQKFYATDSLKSLLGFSNDIPDLDFEKLVELIHTSERESALNSFFAFISGKILTYRHELRLRKSNGEYVWILTRATVTKQDERGRPLVILGTTADITHIKETEKQLLIAKNEAEKASEYKNQFLATMSHEIRTPLNVIIGLTNIMLMSKPKGELKENLNTLSFSANHLLTLINDILDLSKIEAGKLEFNKADFDLYQTIKGVYNTFLPKCNEKKIELSFSIDGSIPIFLSGDSVRLIQILNNLVNNAVKFTERGFVTMKVRPISLNEKSVRLVFEVTDSGMGISQKNQKNIFNDFVQADKTIVHKFGGTGLGLSITKKLIELQGGVIKVKSKPGEGSLFYFELSFQIAKSKSGRGKPTIALKEKTLPLKGMNILLVEDIDANRKVAVSYLEHWGAKTICAVNGLEATERFKEGDYDILLIDLYMPVMNGFDAMKKIRKTKKGAYVPMIALTASAETNTIEKALQCGANASVSKPFDPQQLLETIICLTERNNIELTQDEQNENTDTEDEDSEHLPLKHIKLSILESAALGNKAFIIEMPEMLNREVPQILSECTSTLQKNDYESFANAIHKLKNSLMILGMTDLKKTLHALEENSRKQVNTNLIPKKYSTITEAWKEASGEVVLLLDKLVSGK